MSVGASVSAQIIFVGITMFSAHKAAMKATSWRRTRNENAES